VWSDVHTAVGFTLGSRLVLLGFGFAGSVLSARALGPGDLGRFGLVIATIMILGTVADAGLTAAAQRLIARDRDESPERARQVAFTYARLRAATGVLGGLFVFAAAEPVATLVLGAPELAPRLRLASGTLLALGISSYPGTVLVGLERFRRLAIASVLNSLITFAGVAVLWVAGRLDIDTLVAWNVALPVVSTIPAWLLMPDGWWPWRRTISARPETGASAGTPLRDTARELFASGRWFLGATVGSIVAAQADVLLMGRLVDAATLGTYLLALTLASRFDVLNQSILTVLMPQASRLRGPHAIRRYARRTSKLTVGLALLLVPVAFAAQPFIAVAYGEAFVQAAPLFVGLFVVVLLDLASNALFWLAIPVHRPHILAVAEWLKVATILVVGIALIPRLAGVGAIVARLASRLAAGAYGFVALRGAVTRLAQQGTTRR
jgi:O-antigen/teichoic acid export membrane protein